MTQQTILDQVGSILRDVLNLPDLKVTPATTAENVEGWDSFAHINLVVAIEQHFHIKIHTAEIEELKNVGELTQLVADKLRRP